MGWRFLVPVCIHLLGNGLLKRREGALAYAEVSIFDRKCIRSRKMNWTCSRQIKWHSEPCLGKDGRLRPSPRGNCSWVFPWDSKTFLLPPSVLDGAPPFYTVPEHKDRDIVSQGHAVSFMHFGHFSYEFDQYRIYFLWCEDGLSALPSGQEISVPALPLSICSHFHMLHRPHDSPMEEPCFITTHHFACVLTPVSQH